MAMLQPAAVCSPTVLIGWFAIHSRQIRSAAALLGSWLLVGALVGFVQREQVGPDVTSAVASILAGMIVVPIFGACTIFFGATWRDTLIGAALGGFASLGLVTHSPIGALSLEAGHYILIGAMFATTARPLIVRFCWLLGNLPRVIGIS